MLLAINTFSPQRAAEKNGEPQSKTCIALWPSFNSAALCGLVFFVSFY